MLMHVRYLLYLLTSLYLKKKWIWFSKFPMDFGEAYSPKSLNPLPRTVFNENEKNAQVFSMIKICSGKMD